MHTRAGPGFQGKNTPWGWQPVSANQYASAGDHPHANGDQGVPLNHPALMRCQYKGSHRVKNHSCQVCQPGDNERMEVLNAGCKHRGILEFPGYRSQLARYVSLFFTCLGFSNDIYLVSDVNQCIPFNLRVAEIDPASELLIIQQVVTA